MLHIDEGMSLHLSDSCEMHGEDDVCMWKVAVDQPKQPWNEPWNALASRPVCKACISAVFDDFLIASGRAPHQRR